MSDEILLNDTSENDNEIVNEGVVLSVIFAKFRDHLPFFSNLP